jgi:hypothetical protein
MRLRASWRRSEFATVVSRKDEDHERSQRCLHLPLLPAQKFYQRLCGAIRLNEPPL